jgi:hypothetical protein
VPSSVDLDPVFFVQPLVAAFGVVCGVTGGRLKQYLQHTSVEKLMSDPATPAAAREREQPPLPADDVLTICAISVLAAILANILHEGVGHGLTALLTGADSGLLTTVAWSSTFASRLVEAGGTLVNLAAGLIFWFALRSARGASMPTRYFLLIACAFNLFSGTGYFFFSGVTDFGDWASVILGLCPRWLWRGLLVALGAGSYYAAVRVIGVGLVRYGGVPLKEPRRLRKLTNLPYVSAILLLSLAALLNPLGIQLLWQSALPATAGGQSGLLWLQYYIPRATEPQRTPEPLCRNSVWVGVAVVLAFLYVVVLGRGITLHLAK